MLKSLMTLCAALCCGALGTLFALRLSRRARRLSIWRAAFVRLSGALSYAGFPLCAALRYAARPEAERLAQLADRIESAPAESVEALFSALPKEEVLRFEDEEAILSGVRALSMQTVEEQCAALKLTVETLQTFAEDARRENDKNARLFAGGGCLAGAALLLILL